MNLDVLANIIFYGTWGVIMGVAVFALWYMSMENKKEFFVVISLITLLCAFMWSVERIV